MKNAERVALVLLASAVSLVFAGCQPAAATAGSGGVAAPVPVRVDLKGKLPPTFTATSIEVSIDRKRALIDGNVPVMGPEGRVARFDRKCILLTIDKGIATPVLDLFGGSKASAELLHLAAMSPDGQYLAVDSSQPVVQGAAPRCKVRLLDIASGKVVGELDRSANGLVWAGKRLLLSGGESGKVQAYDPVTKKLEDLPIFGEVTASDLAGDRLLACAGMDPMKKPSGDDNPVQLVITPQGKVLCQLDKGGSSCSRQVPFISPNGEYAALIHLPDSWSEFTEISTRAISLDDGKVSTIPWAYFMAVTDNGEPICCGEKGLQIGRKKWEEFVPGDQAHAGKVVGGEFFYLTEPGHVFKSVTLPPVVDKPDWWTATKPASAPKAP